MIESTPKQLLYDCILVPLVRAVQAARTASDSSLSLEVPQKMRSLRELRSSPTVHAKFAAVRLRKPGPVIGQLNGGAIYAYIAGANGERWEFDGQLYPGRAVGDDAIVAANRAVYVLRTA